MIDDETINNELLKLQMLNMLLDEGTLANSILEGRSVDELFKLAAEKLYG
jgi:hypothetical protein